MTRCAAPHSRWQTMQGSERGFPAQQQPLSVPAVPGTSLPARCLPAQRGRQSQAPFGARAPGGPGRRSGQGNWGGAAGEEAATGEQRGRGREGGKGSLALKSSQRQARSPPTRDLGRDLEVKARFY